MSYGGKVKKMEKGGALKTPDNPGLKKLPESVRNNMGYMKKGGKVKPGYHKMPDGKIMKDSAHKKMNESKLMKKDGRNVAKAKMQKAKTKMQKAKTMKRGGKC